MTKFPILSVGKYHVGLTLSPTVSVQFVRLIPGVPLFGHSHQFARVGRNIVKYWTVNIGRLEFGVIH